MRTSLLAVLLALVPACGGGSTPGDVDGGRMDSGGGDGGDRSDATTSDDASTTDDATTGDDAATGDDASTSDDGGVSDVDGCTPPSCPAPPEGCNYVGGTACTCGTLVCMGCGGPGTPACDPATELCEYPLGTCGGTGTCIVRPDVCTALYMPVCGCDGSTYSNPCYARAAGQSVSATGMCGGGGRDASIGGRDAGPGGGDCRTTGCPPGSTCEPCRGVGGLVYVCIRAGSAC